MDRDRIGRKQRNSRFLLCLGGSAGDLFFPALTLAIAGRTLHQFVVSSDAGSLK